MDVDSTDTVEKSDTKKKESDQINGLSNGYPEKHKSHKSDHKDKHRDKERHRSKDHKSSSRDKDKHNSSSSKDKERHSSSHKSSNKDKEHDREKHRDRDKEKRRDRDEKKSSSSSTRDKEQKSSKDKDHKSSSSRDKEKYRDRKDEKHKDKSKDRHSSSKDKDRHSSSKDKRDKERHSSSKKKEKIEEVKVILKREESFDSAREDSIDEDEPKLVIKEEPLTQEEVNVSTGSSCDYNLSQFKDESIKKEEVEDETQSSDEDMPLAVRAENSKRRQIKSEEEEEDDLPLNVRKKIKQEIKLEKKSKKRRFSDDEEDDDYEEHKPIKKEKKGSKKKIKVEIKDSISTVESKNTKKGGRKKKEEEQQEVWKWWEEEKKEDGTKWKFLEHKGPIFAPPYERLPEKVKFYYDDKEMRLSEDAEEVAGFYAKMLDHDYTTKKAFNDNFFKDWRKSMTDKERSKITDLTKCNFKGMHRYFTDLAEKNRNRTKEEKLELKLKNEELIKEYGFCKIDGHVEKIGNFKIEPPGLFRGRGEHPKMGLLKKRVCAGDIIINCSKDATVPTPPEGQKWREVRHDSSVTWLASWTENVQNQVKYIMLNPSSKLKGEKDWQKYETARRLHKCIDKIRHDYKQDWKSKEMRIRQRAVAMYFIDRLALRAGNEKDEDQADTVGCCSLRIEHIELHEKKDDLEYVVVFDFLGKDSIRYYNEVPVEKRVFKNLQLFTENKKGADDLFDRLNTAILNKHLTELMEGLTAKVFRTYNASFTLQQQLDKLSNADESLSEKILSYNRANRAVAILCNHQRAVPKGHEKSMEKLKEKIDAKRDSIKDAERQVKDAQKDAKRGSVKEKFIFDKKKKLLQRLKEQLGKLEIQETDRDENKTIALGTSKLNYLDPRISVAWCKKYDVPIEKIYNKTQRDKFRWAIDMAGPDYRF